MRRKTKQKVLAFGLAALLAASNVIPAVAAYGAPGSSTWQGSLNLDSSIMKRTMLTGKVGTGSEVEEPSTGAPSIEESKDSTDETAEAEEKPAETIEEALRMNRAGTFEITSEDELVPFFPDSKFRAVVFKAVKDGGDGAAGADVEEALANFTGEINARKKGIRDISGIKYLINAETVNLSENEITDWRPAAAGSWEHYGHGATGGADSANVTWIIDRNPFAQLPYTFGGRLVIEQPATHAYTYKYDASVDKTFSFVRRADDAGKYFEGTYHIGRCEIEEENSGMLEPVEIISVAAVKGTWDKPIMNAEKVDNTTANLSHIMKSGTQLIGVGVDEILRYDTVDEFNTSTPGEQSFKYYLKAKVAVFDSVSIEQNSYRGSVVLTKADDGNSDKKLPGATYELVKGTPGTPGEVVCTRTTDAQGTITVLDLEPGKYYFKEVKAPAGYNLNPNVEEFEVFNRDVQLGGGSTTALDGAASVAVGDSDHERYIAGPTSYGNGTPDITLSLVPGSKPGDLPLLGKARYEVVYSSIGASPDNANGEQITKIFYMPEEAAADINKYKQDNRITGPVKIKVTFEKTAAGAIAISTTDTPVPDVKIEPVTELSGTKVWKDEPGYTGLHPDVIISVYRKGDKSKTPVRNLTLHDGQEAFKFYDLPKYDNSNNEIQYEVEEIFADSAESDDFYVSQTGNTITNTYIRAKIDIEGKKGWNDEGWEDKVTEEPEHPTITIDLYRNDEYYKSCEITPNQDSYRFADLDLRDRRGNDYKYTVKERAVTDWTSYSRNTYDFENVFTPGTSSDPPPKKPSTGGGGGGGNGITSGGPPTGPGIEPTEPYSPGITPPEGTPPTPGLSPETPSVTPSGQNPKEPDAPAPLPKTGEADSPIFYTIFWSASLALAGWYTMNQRKKEAEAENQH